MNHKDKVVVATTEKKKFSKNNKGKRAYIAWRRMILQPAAHQNRRKK